MGLITAAKLTALYETAKNFLIYYKRICFPGGKAVFQLRLYVHNRENDRNWV